MRLGDALLASVRVVPLTHSIYRARGAARTVRRSPVARVGATAGSNLSRQERFPPWVEQVQDVEVEVVGASLVEVSSLRGRTCIDQRFES